MGQVTDELDDETLAFAERMFDLARNGETEALAQRLDVGLPVDLTNAAGDTLLILAAYHDHPATVRALLARHADTARLNDRGQSALVAAVFRRSDAVDDLLAAGADPTHGAPSALATAQFFDLAEMLAKLQPSAGTAAESD